MIGEGIIPFQTAAGPLRAFLMDRQEEMVAFLSDLVLAESPSSDPGSQTAVLNKLAEALRALEYESQLIAGEASGGHLYARPGRPPKDIPRQLLLGHCDTVWPIGTLANMPLVVRDNMLSGPGAYDMKAGLAQMIFALRALEALSLPPQVSPELFINSDEELGSHDSTPHLRRLAPEMDRVLVLEPSLGLDGRLKTGRKGVGRYRIEITGRAAHAGLDPDKGVSAILELSYIIQKLTALNDPSRGVGVNVGLVAGGLRPNVIPPAASAEVDVRLPTREDAQRIEAAILALEPVTAGAELRIEGGINRWPLEPTPANRALWAQAQAAAGCLGIELAEGTAGGGSDGNTTSLYTATLDGLGAVGDGAHARHEFIYLDRLVERTALLALLLLAPPLRDGGNDHV
jgi:glutamate carboxypeptidase